MTNRRVALRLFAVACLGVYAARRFANPEHWDFVDDLNLAVHEAGHLVLNVGDQLQFLGGSLFQVIVPLAFVAYFLMRAQRFAAAVTLSWAGWSLLNVARYIGDARAQELPLLGGEDAIHDWWYLLTEWDLLPQDLAIARAVRAVAALVVVVSLAGGIAFARERDEAAVAAAA